MHAIMFKINLFLNVNDNISQRPGLKVYERECVCVQDTGSCVSEIPVIYVQWHVRLKGISFAPRACDPNS